MKEFKIRIWKPPISGGVVLYCWEVEIGFGQNFIDHVVMPYPFPEIIVPLKYPIIIEGYKSPQLKPFFCPILTTPKKIEMKSGSSFFGVRLDPVLANNLVTVNSSHFKGRTYDTGKIFSAGLNMALDKLVREQDSFEERALIIYKVLEKECIRRKTQKLEIIQHLIENVAGINNLNMQQICSKAGCSQRWMEIIFKDTLHLRPKQYQRICRFNKFISRISEKKEGDSLCSLALECGYYDQAHLIRETREFSGIPPKRLITNFSALYGMMNHT